MQVENKICICNDNRADSSRVSYRGIVLYTYSIEIIPIRAERKKAYDDIIIAYIIDYFGHTLKLNMQVENNTYTYIKTRNGNFLIAPSFTLNYILG